MSNVSSLSEVKGKLIRNILRVKAKKILANKLNIVPSTLTKTKAINTPIVATNPQNQLPTTLSQPEIIVKADKLTLIVETFSPVFNLTPTIDVTSPNVNVEVSSPTINIEPPSVVVENKPDIRIDIPKQDSPSIVNQISLPAPEVKEVNVTMPERRNKTRKITVIGPNGEYTGIVSEVD